MLLTHQGITWVGDALRFSVVYDMILETKSVKKNEEEGRGVCRF